MRDQLGIKSTSVSYRKGSKATSKTISSKGKSGFTHIRNIKGGTGKTTYKYSNNKGLSKRPEVFKSPVGVSKSVNLGGVARNKRVSQSSVKNTRGTRVAKKQVLVTKSNSSGFKKANIGGRRNVYGNPSARS